MELIQSEKHMEAERNQKIIRIIFAGIMEMILTGVEDSRREASPLYIPKFSAFVKYLSAGSGMSLLPASLPLLHPPTPLPPPPGGGLSMAQRDNCWEKVEVSSNSHRSCRMLDNDSSTYWESTGRSGSHWIRLYVKKGLIIK